MAKPNVRPELRAGAKTFDDAEASLEKAGRVEELIRLYESRAREVPLREESAHLLSRAGELARDRLKAFARSEELYRRALAAHAGFREALEGLKALYEQQQDLASLAESLERLAAQSASAESAALYLKAADLHEHKLSRKDRAVLCCQLASRAAPHDRQAARRARSLLCEEARFRPAFESLERERATQGGNGMADEYSAFAEALVEDPLEHGLAKEALRIAKELDPKNDRADKALQAIAELERDWRNKARSLKAASLEERDRKRAARLSLAVAKLHAFYDRDAKAKVKEALDRCFLLWPAMPQAVALVERLAKDNGELSLAASLLEKMIDGIKEKGAKIDLCLSVASMKLTRLEPPDRAGALAIYEKATAEDPSRADAASLAAELLLEEGRGADALKVLEQHLATLKDRSARLGLHLRLVELASNDEARALRHLEAALGLDPANVDAAFGLASLFVKHGDKDRLLPLLELAAYARRPVADRVALCQSAARLFEQHGELPKSLEALCLALYLRPEDAGLLSGAREAAAKSDAFESLAIALRRCAQAAPEPAATTLWRSLATLLASPLSKALEAESAWQEVLKRAPEDPEALSAVAALKRAAAAAPALDERSRLEAEARRLEDSAADPAEAVAVYRKLLELSPDNVDTLKRLGAGLAALSRWEEVAEVAERLLALAGNLAERQEWRSRLAQLYAERLHREEEAARLYLGLLEEGVASAAVVGGLEQLASRGVRPADISRALAPQYSKSGDHQRQVASLLVQLSSAQSKDEQKSLLSILAQTCERNLLDTKAAFDFLLRGISVDPLDSGFRAEARRLARTLSTHAELARLLVQLGSKCEDPAQGSALLREAAEVSEEGGLIDEAAAALKAALAITPADPFLLLGLVRLFTGAGRKLEADQALRQLLAVAPVEERAALWLKLSELSVELARPNEAAQALREAIAAGADEAEHLPKVAHFLEEAGRAAELSEVLARLIELAQAAGDPSRATNLSLKRARLLESSLGDKVEAVGRYAQVLSQRPSDPDALAALEHLCSDPACSAEAARALVPVYEALKDHRKLVAALGLIADGSKDTFERVQALQRAASIHAEHLRQPEQAFASLAGALRLSCEDEAIRKATRAAAEDADAVELYAEVLEELLEGRAGPIAVALHREAAEVYEKKLADRSTAQKHLRAVLELEPKSVEALKGLGRLHRAEEQWASLVEVIERLGTLLSDPAEKISLWREAATLSEQRLSSAERATAAWRQLSAIDPLDRAAAASLDRLYTALDKPVEQAFAIELRRAQEGQSPQGRELAFRLAILRRDRLEDLPGALQLFRQILEEDPAHQGTRDALEEWVRQAGVDAAIAMEILDPVLARFGDHAKRISLRQARMADASTNERARLAKEQRAIYERDLNQPQAAFMAALKAFTDGLDRDSVREDLERLARDTGSFGDLAEIYETTASELDPADEAAAELWRRAAQVRESLNQFDDAVRDWKELLALLPQDRAALDALGALYERGKNAKSLSEVYSRQAQLASDPAERLGLLHKAGAAFEEAGEDAAAIDAYKQALAIKKSQEGLLALDRLFGRAKRQLEQADVLAQLVELAADPTQARAYTLRRAQLLEKEGQAAAAVRDYATALEGAEPAAIAGLERLLDSDQARVESARLLEPYYRSQNDLKRLVEVLEILVGAAAPKQRLPLLSEVATLREALGQKALAFAVRLRAFTENVELAEPRTELERLAADLGSFEELAAAYEDQLERGVSEKLALTLWRRLAVLYGERLARNDLAARAYEEVHRRQPDELPVLEALARLYQRLSAFRELAGVIEKQVALEPKLEAQVQHLFELARLAEETLSDKALAARAYQQVLSRKADDPNAIKFLGRVLLETERYDELAEHVGKEIEQAEARGAIEESLELMVRLGRIKLTRLEDPRGALGLYQKVLEKRPNHVGAVGALEEMARSESPLRGEAAAALEPVFATHGEHLKLVQMLESRASAETVPQERAALFRKVAELYSSTLENPEMGFVTATRALREVPDDASSLELCLSLVQAADAADELVELLSEVAGKASSDQSRAALFRALARLQQTSGEEEAAAASWKRVLELLPSDSEALEAIGRLLSQGGKVNELLEVLRRQLSMAEEPEKRAALMFQIGVLQDDVQKDGPSALATFRRVLELKPDDSAALERMEKLCEKLSRWPELADVLARRVALAAEDATGDLKYRLAQVRDSRLSDRFGALELYSEILAAQPQHAGALAAVEAIVEREPQNQVAVDVLLKALRATGQSAKLAQLIEARVAVSGDSEERKALLDELAGIRKAQEEPELAYLALWRAFREDPNDAPLRARLEQAADEAKTYDELASAYEEELPRVAEGADAAAVCLKLASLLEQRLSEPERAVTFYEKALSFDPTCAAAALPSLDRLYGAMDRPEEQARTLEALCGIVSEPKETAGLLFRLAQLYQERLSNPANAIAAFERLLAIDAKHLPALRMLELLFEQAGTSDKLFATLEKQRDLVSGPEKERILAKMAQVSAESLEDIDHSIELYRELLAKNPRNEQAHAALERLLEKAGRAEELKALIEAKLAHTIDPRELVRLNDRLGRVVGLMLNRPDEAIAYFKSALDRDARHKGALESLLAIYEKLERNEDLVIVLRRLVPLQEGAEGVKAIRLKLASVLAQMNRREEALDAARRALEIEPHTAQQLEQVHQVFISLKALSDAVRALELRSQVELAQEDREAAVATLFKVAELWIGPGAKPESAGPALEKVLEIDPANPAAYEKARALYSQVNDWRAYAQLIDRYHPNLVTDEEKIAALQELAQVQEQKLGQKHVAFLAMCRALQLDPSQQALRDQVERLAEETGSHEELAAVYEELAEGLPRGPLAEHMYLVLARVHDAKLDDPAAAEAALRKILEFDPTNSKALDALAGMFSHRGRDKEYVVSLEQKLEAAGSIESRKEILREIARVFDERLNEPNEAAAALLRALELEPDPQTLDVLVALYRRQKEHQAVAHTLLRARDLAPSPEERSRLQTEVALVYERDLNDDEAAVEGYRVALEFDPGNRTALDALERLYTKLDRPAELLAVYERQLELSQDYRERVKVLFKSASIWEDRYQNLANADACIEGVLSMDPQNLQAIKVLERLRKAQERWEELVGVFARHVELLSELSEQAELYVQMGDVFHNELRQVDRAVGAYQQALELDSLCRPAMHALGTLYERSGNWPFALEMLQREAEAAGATPDAVEVYYRMGKINEDMLIDSGSAKTCFQRALEINPAYLPALRSLKGVYELEKDWIAYETTLVQEADKTDEPEAKSRAQVEVGRFFLEHKEDRPGAAHWFEEALRLVPDSFEAARPLADIYIAQENWEGAEQMLDIVVLKMTERAAQEQDDQLAGDLCRQHYRLGYVVEKRANKDKALENYQKAYQLDSTYLPALEGLGNLLVQAGRAEEALKVYSTILIHHRDDLSDLEVVEIYWQIGDIYLGLKQLDRAQNHFDKALAIDPAHEASLRALVRLADEAAQFDRAAEYRQRLIEVLDGEAKLAVCLELGKLAREKLKDAYMAVDAYLGALKIDPARLDVLDALYVLYRETKQGAKAAEVLESMLAQPALKAEPGKAKRVHFALGEIARDELMEVDRAVACFNAALDLDYRFIEAFSAIEALLGKNKKWKALEENYARMIQRMPKTEETHVARMTLWRALGDLYVRVLKHPESALMAYKVVAAGLPEDSATQESYAQLAAQQPGQEDEAIAAYRRALANTTNPGKVASALAELAAKKKDYDSAWLAAQVSSGLIGETGQAEKEILAKLTPYAKKKEVATRSLTDRLWQTHLFHPKIRGPISELMAILFEQAGHLYKEDFAKYQINPKKHLIDVASAQEFQIHHFRYVARLLGMEQVTVYSPFLVATRERLAKRSSEPAPDPTVSLEVCHTHPVCLKAGGKFFSETGQKETYYVLGRTLALLRPELALAQRLPAERLEAVFQAALSLSAPSYRFTADPRAIDAERRPLEKALPEPARQALARVTREYLKVAGPNDLRGYLEGAELSAVRAGLFVAGEVEPVKKMVMGESGAAYRVQARSKIRDLMVFALSEDLHALRVAVGTHVEVQVRR